ncbi:polysaccharide deacetylase family protein [Nitratifractor sp.]
MQKERRAILKWGSMAAAAWLLGGCGQGPAVPGGSERYSVYLSSDDGPLRGSANLDAAIRETKVPLTAFVVGKHARPSLFHSYLEGYRNNPYINLANHSYTHANGRYIDYYLHPGRVLADFEKNRAVLGLVDRRGRLPGRDSWRLGGRAYDADRSARAAADLLAANGYTLYGWDLEWTHTHSGRPIGTAEDLYRRIKFQLHRGHTYTPGHLMLLMHDQMFGTLSAKRELKRLITLLKSDPQIRLRPLADYPLSAPPREAPATQGPWLIKGSPTGVGETTPVDPLHFSR